MDKRLREIQKAIDFIRGHKHFKDFDIKRLDIIRDLEDPHQFELNPVTKEFVEIINIKFNCEFNYELKGYEFALIASIF